MTVRRGRFYANKVPAARAAAVLVVSEDPWNDTMRTSVVVPLYPLGDLESEGTFHVPVGRLSADCTLVQSLDHDDLGDEQGACPEEALAAVEHALRIYLDIDDLLEQRIRRPPAVGRSGFWPRQRGIYWGRRFGRQRERYAVLPSDEVNVRSQHTAMLFLRSRDKAWRSRWQVPREGGWVIAGDIDQLAYGELEDRRRPSPDSLSRAEMADIARAVSDVLEL